MKKILALLFAISPIFGYATIIDLNITGTITRLTYSDCQTYGAGGSCTSWTFTDIPYSTFVSGKNIAAGNVFTLSLQYDTASPLNSITPDGFQAIYFSSVGNQYFSAGEISLPGSGMPNVNKGSISIVDGRSGVDYLGINSVFGGARVSASMNIGLQDRTGAVFTNFSIPASFRLAAFTETGMSIGFIRDSDKDILNVDGTFATLTTTAVPEPSSMLLILFGASALFVFLRHRPYSDTASPNTAA